MPLVPISHRVKGKSLHNQQDFSVMYIKSSQSANELKLLVKIKKIRYLQLRHSFCIEYYWTCGTLEKRKFLYKTSECKHNSVILQNMITEKDNISVVTCTIHLNKLKHFTQRQTYQKHFA